MNELDEFIKSKN